MEDFSPSPYNFSADSDVISLSLKKSALVSRGTVLHVGDTLSEKRIYNAGLVPAALASCTFQITVQGPGSHIQSTELNNTTVFK